MLSSDSKTHWEKIYAAKTASEVSWYRPHLETSLALIERAAKSAPVIDVGGGESTLVDDLLARGYLNITVLDISEIALATAKKRLGKAADRVRWIAADATQAALENGAYAVWHDRAVFHFLASPQRRAAYVETLARAVKPGGHAIIATFGPDGPAKCSGLDVTRYSGETLQREVGAGFKLLESSLESHLTPSGATQQFLYCCFRRK